MTAQQCAFLVVAWLLVVTAGVCVADWFKGARR